MQRQRAVSAYLESKQILPFGFAWQHRGVGGRGDSKSGWCDLQAGVTFRSRCRTSRGISLYYRVCVTSLHQPGHRDDVITGQRHYLNGMTSTSRETASSMTTTRETSSSMTTTTCFVGRYFNNKHGKQINQTYTLNRNPIT